MHTGEEILEAAERLIVSTLKAAPHDLTNSEVGAATRLNPRITKQRGYVTWTILRHLMEQGRVEQVDSRYRLIDEES